MADKQSTEDIAFKEEAKRRLEKAKADEKRIKEYVANHPEEFKYCDAKESILKAINILDDIEIYNNYVESDSYTEEICWSSFEDRSAEEILGE